MSASLERLWYPSREEPEGQPLAALPLGVASLFFRAAVRAREALWASGALQAERVEGLRVVSVGNITVGGSGKTPAVIHLAQMAHRAGRKVAVLSRGYGRSGRAELSFSAPGPLPEAEESGDEPLLIARRCPGVTLLVGADRVKLARRARELGAELALLDDGMQHRRLAREVDLAVVDEAVGFGNGQLLPRGPLREPLSALSRASLIWLRVSSSPPAPLPSFEAPVVRVEHRPCALTDPRGEEHQPSHLAGAKVIALSAIARPKSFWATLAQVGIEVAERRPFADHHRFTPQELEEALLLSQRTGLAIVTTEKDQARLPGGFPAWVLRLEVTVLAGDEHLRRALGL